VERLIYSSDRDEVLRAQGVAQALVEVVGLPDGLEAEIVAERFRAVMRAGFQPADGSTPLPPAFAGTSEQEPY
jgi:hypothetical protein